MRERRCEANRIGAKHGGTAIESFDKGVRIREREAKQPLTRRPQCEIRGRAEMGRVSYANDAGPSLLCKFDGKVDGVCASTVTKGVISVENSSRGAGALHDNARRYVDATGPGRSNVVWEELYAVGINTPQRSLKKGRYNMVDRLVFGSCCAQVPSENRL
jgi:hypothetical protein